MTDSFGSAGFSAQAAGGAAQENKAEGILPVMIYHVLNSTDNGVKLYNMHYSMITLVVIVRRIEQSSTKVTYLLEDHTGQVEAHLWLEEDNSKSIPKIALNKYARVVGSVRNQGGIRAVMIFRIDQVGSPNDVTTHLLEVLNSRCEGKELFENGAAADNAEKAGPSSGGFMETDAATMGLTGKQLAVYKAIKAHISENGISRKELLQKFAHIGAAEMQTITDYMTQEGLIYTSVDSDHFLCVDA